MRIFPVLLFLLTQPCLAGQTEWQDVLPDVRMRLVAMPYFGQGHEIAAAIEIDMPASHKTYWRIPGDGGFSAEIDLSNSQGIDDFYQIWPLPSVETNRSGTDYVYRGRSFLPFSVLPTAEMEPILEVKAFIGICATVCMPVDVAFELKLNDDDLDSFPQFSKALARIPVPWPFGGAPIESLHSTEQGITVRFNDTVEPRSIVIADETGRYGSARAGLDGIDLPLVSGVPPLSGDRVKIDFETDIGIYSVEQIVLP